MNTAAGIRLLDANVILRWVIQDVPEQTRSTDRFFANASPGSLRLTDVTALETVYVMEKVYGHSRRLIAQTLQFVIEHRAVRANDRTLLEALDLYQLDHRISFADAYLCACQRQTKHSTLVTFDRRLGRHANAQRPD